MRTTALVAIGIIAGATLGGFCGWAINARFWHVIQDQENFWAWSTIIGGGIGVVLLLALDTIARQHSRP